MNGGIPVLTVVDTSKTITVLIDNIVGSEKTSFEALDLGQLAAADKQMADRELAKHFSEKIIQIAAAGKTVQIVRVLRFGIGQAEPMQVGS